MIRPDWKPGDRALCVDVEPDMGTWLPGYPLVEGEVYTVTGLAFDPGCDFGLVEFVPGWVLFLAEVSHPVAGWGFSTHRFVKLPGIAALERHRRKRRRARFETGPARVSVDGREIGAVRDFEISVSPRSHGGACAGLLGRGGGG